MVDGCEALCQVLPRVNMLAAVGPGKRRGGL